MRLGARWSGRTRTHQNCRSVPLSRFQSRPISPVSPRWHNVTVSVTVDQLMVGDTSQAWAEAGFLVTPENSCQVGGVRIQLLGSDQRRGILGWSLGGLSSALAEFDGIATSTSGSQPIAHGEYPTHLNGVIGIDHVVALSPNLSRTLEEFAALGIEPRLQRDVGGKNAMRQVFYRLGEVVVEVIGAPEQTNEGPTELWGITYVVADIAASARFFGDKTGRVKDAVQPGRQITTLRHRELGISVPTALITPRDKPDKSGNDS